MKAERQSNIELLKIFSMLMIVAHHYVAKNVFNVDFEIPGVTVNKLFLQLFGNNAFIGNNLFFMCSAWFLVDRSCGLEGYPKRQLKHIWSMEKTMLFYSLSLWSVFHIIYGGGTASLPMLGKSLFPMSMGVWWYPTTYAVFLMIQPFLQKGLLVHTKDELKKLIVTMICIWSLSSLVPFFQYGYSSFICFIMLYTIIFYEKNYVSEISIKKMRGIIIGGYALAVCSIVLLDIIGLKVRAAAEYSCYFIRGNWRPIPLVISIAVFNIATKWKMKTSKVINTIASYTFGVYLIHMYPLVMGFLFSNEDSLLNLKGIIRLKTLPLIAILHVVLLFISLLFIEAIRKAVFHTVERLIHPTVIQG